MKPARARQLVEYLRTSYRISIRRACGVGCFDRSTYHDRHRRPEQASLRKRIVSAQLTAHSMLRRDGTEMVSTIKEVDTIDERSLKPFET